MCIRDSIGPVQIYGKLSGVLPNTTYTFRVMADYQAYFLNNLDDGLAIRGASLLAFNTAFNSGVFRAVHGAGRLYNNGANSINWADVCGQGCVPGSPANLRTPQFTAAATPTSWVGFGSSYDWVTKGGGAADINNFGLAVTAYPVLPAATFNTPYVQWNSSVVVSHQYQGSKPKNCLNNGISTGCDVGAAMTNAVLPSTALTGTAGWWGGLTGSLTGQVAGVNGDVLFFETTSQSPTWASPISVNGTVVGGMALVSWTASGEQGTAAWRVERFDPAQGAFVVVGPDVMAALPPSPIGATYEVEDTTAVAGQTYQYRLVETETNGAEVVHGPYPVTIGVAGKNAAANQPSALATQALDADEGGYHRTVTPLSNAPVKRGTLSLNDLPWAKSSWKAYVYEEGIYSIPLSASSDPEMSRNHGLTDLGQQVAVGNDGPNKRILFYGTPLHTTHTDRNAYLLRPMAPKFMKEINGRVPPDQSQPSGFPYTKHFEQDVIPALAWPYKENDDFWFWQYLRAEVASDSSVSIPFSVPLLSADGGKASISFSVYSLIAPPGVADLRFNVFVNGVPAGNVAMSGKGAHTAVVSFQSANLKEGNNTLQLDAVLGPGITRSWWFLNSFDVTYPRRFEALNNATRIRAAAGQKVVTVTGFTVPDVLVFDVTAPQAPVWVKATAVRQIGKTSYSVTFPSDGNGADFFVAAGDAIRTAALQPLVDAGLKGKNAGARHIVIAPYDLLVAAGELAKYRTATGLTSVAVPLEAIWDEFGEGLPSPEAIKSFLTYASTNWYPSPGYVVLAGKGTYDENNVLGRNDSLLPTNFRMSVTGTGLFGTDAPYVAGTAMSIGRIPVTTGASLLDFVKKVAAHEASGPNYEVTLLAGKSDPAAGDFPKGIQEIASSIPYGYKTTLSDLDSKSFAQVRQDAISALGRGDSLVAWVGHGGLTSLGSEGVLTSADVPSLPGTEHLSLLAGATCYINGFYYSGFSPLGESLVTRAGGGVVASWAPGGPGLNVFSTPLVNDFAAELYSGRARAFRLGDVIRASQAPLDGGSGNAYPLWPLLGDPGSVVP